MGSTEFLILRLSAKIPMVSPVGNGMALLSLKFKNFFIDVVSQESHVFRYVHPGRAVGLAHFAQQTGVNGFGVFQYFFLQTQQHVPEQLPGEKLDAHGANRAADAAIHASRGVEGFGLFNRIDKTGVDQRHYFPSPATALYL
jgi:hypothetical protein